MECRLIKSSKLGHRSICSCSAHSARRGTERSREPLTPRRAGLRCALSQWRVVHWLDFKQMPEYS